MSIALRWIAAPLLAIATVAPAQAQQAVGLDWMIGRWCLNSGTCLDIHERADGAVITDWKAADGRSSQGVITMENGRAVLTTQGVRAAVEDSRGPNEIILKSAHPEPMMSDGLAQLRYSRDGDALTLEFTLGGGKVVPYVYRRED